MRPSCRRSPTTFWPSTPPCTWGPGSRSDTRSGTSSRAASSRALTARPDLQRVHHFPYDFEKLLKVFFKKKQQGVLHLEPSSLRQLLHLQRVQQRGGQKKGQEEGGAHRKPIRFTQFPLFPPQKKPFSNWGTNAGLKMTLNLELGSYMRRGLTASEGARVAIFPKDINLVPKQTCSTPIVEKKSLQKFTSKMPDEYGVNLHPETKTEISLKSRSYSRLAAPFSSRCIRGWEDTEYSKVQLRNRGAYTIQV